MKSLQKFAAVHASLLNHFITDRHLIDRPTYKTNRSAALAEWQSLMSWTDRNQGQVVSIGELLQLV